MGSMKDSYKPLWLILFVAAGLAALVGVSRMRGGYGDYGPEKVPWTTDLTAARERSAKEHKPVLLYFTASWCGPCQQMKRTTWADAKVAAAVEKYIPVKIDIDEQKAVAMQFGVDGIPRIEVLGPGGDTRALVSEGGLSPDDFLASLAKVGGV